MNMILQDRLPPAMTGAVALPGMGPCAPDDWLQVDEAYGAQMRCRTGLLAMQREAVLWLAPEAQGAAQEVLAEALEVLPGLGFEVRHDAVVCPDGRIVERAGLGPLALLGHLVQEDICILQKRGDQHVLTGAVLCFPANWRLADKAGRPLTDIHAPVPDYAGNIARRVQRLFDGVKAGRPLWRFNRLRYAQPDLHQPWRKQGGQKGAFIRSERQCIVRMPKTDAVVFSIHTYVVRAS